MGSLNDIDKQNFKALASRMEELITGDSGLPFQGYEASEEVGEKHNSILIK